MNKKGEALLYAKMQKAIYRLLRIALMFYLNLFKYLEAFGFEIKPYDSCVENNIINGQQMIVTWHVDDLKVYYKYSFQVTNIYAYLSLMYDKNLKVTCGKVHDYLGIYLY